MNKLTEAEQALNPNSDGTEVALLLWLRLQPLLSTMLPVLGWRFSVLGCMSMLDLIL